MLKTLFFKTLGDETRLRCLFLLHAEGELCVCELTASLEQSQPKVSRHLAQMRQCGVLSDRREGQWVYYRIHPDLPEWAVEILQVIAGSDSPDSVHARDRQRLLQLVDRPDAGRLCCT